MHAENANQTITPASPELASEPPARPGLVLAAACVCQLMVVLDISVVNVALPGIDAALGFGTSSLTYVVSAYTLTFGGLLLLGGRIADLFGHRRTMVGALAVFGVASALGGSAQSPGQLIAARAAQGVAAAVLSPVTLTVIMVTFAEGPARRRAVATWGMVATGGGALGVLLSGLLTEYLDWRWVLFVNAPLAVAGAALALLAVRDLHPPMHARLDVPGAVLATLSLVSLTYGCVHAGEHGWRSGMTVATLLAAVVGSGSFIAWELRTTTPLVRLSVLRARAVWLATVTMCFIGAVSTTGFYFLSLFLQNVLGYSPVRTGLAFLPFCTGMAVATLASSALVERFGARVVLSTGPAVGAVGMLAFGRLDAGSGLGALLLATIPTSLGLGACIAPTLSMGTSGAIRTQAGMVSGLLNTSRQAGGSVALAAMATLASRVTANAGHGVGAVADGYRAAFDLSGVLLFAVAVVAAALVPMKTGTASR